MMAEADRMKLEAEKMTAEMASRAATLHPAMSIINPGEDNTTDPDGDYGDKARATDPIDAQLEDDVMPGKVVLPTGAPGSLAFTHTETTGTKVTAVSAVGLPLTGYVPPADGMAPEIDGWDGLVLTRRDAVDAASQILYAYTDVATVATETFYQKYGAQLSQTSSP